MIHAIATQFGRPILNSPTIKILNFSNAKWWMAIRDTDTARHLLRQSRLIPTPHVTKICESLVTTCQGWCDDMFSYSKTLLKRTRL